MPLDAGRFVFLDESGAKTNMTRLYGRGLRGERVRDYAPHGHWNSTTMIGAIRLDGTTCCMTLDGAMDRDAYREFVRYVLCPALRQGDIVVADNLRAHKDAESERLIEQRGATCLYLPPYSPDFNPIEKMWSKVKNYLRSAKARTVEELNEAIGRAFQSISASDATGYFFSCGYTTCQS